MRTGPLLLQEKDRELRKPAEEHQHSLKLQAETCWVFSEREMLKVMEVKPGVSVCVLEQVWASRGLDVDQWMEEAQDGMENTEDLLNAGGAQTQEHTGKILEAL